MTDPVEHPRTEAEIAAYVDRSAAEAAKFRAEADKAEAEARDAYAKAAVSELAADEKIQARRETEAGDVYHHVYRFNGGVDASTVGKAVTKTTEWHRLDPGCAIEIIFHSPGGAVIDGFALFDHLRWLSSQDHKITTGCTGMAASMAGILMQAGDHRWMSQECWYMIHRAAFAAHGQTFDIEDEVEWVKRIEKRIVDIFVARSNVTAQKIRRNWDRKDWWIDSDQALEYGLVDEIRGAATLTE